MKTLRGGNNWKAAGVLFLMAAFIGILLLVPVLRSAPETTPAVDLPAMSNVPPVGNSHSRP
jgi:hypothetical protein